MKLLIHIGLSELIRSQLGKAFLPEGLHCCSIDVNRILRPAAIRTPRKRDVKPPASAKDEYHTYIDAA
jgi:hypothetical protein